MNSWGNPQELHQWLHMFDTSPIQASLQSMIKESPILAFLSTYGRRDYIKIVARRQDLVARRQDLVASRQVGQDLVATRESPSRIYIYIYIYTSVLNFIFSIKRTYFGAKCLISIQSLRRPRSIGLHGLTQFKKYEVICWTEHEMPSLSLASTLLVSQLIAGMSPQKSIGA